MRLLLSGNEPDKRSLFFVVCPAVSYRLLLDQQMQRSNGCTGGLSFTFVEIFRKSIEENCKKIIEYIDIIHKLCYFMIK